MRQRKYTLPRHTNLAKLGPRIGAFLVDLAICFGLALGFYFGAFQFIFKTRVNAIEENVTQEKINSRLYDSEDGKLKNWDKDSSDNDIKDGLAYFYTVYIPIVEASSNEPVILTDGTKVSKLDYFTVEWFNKNVLKVESDGASLFEYVKVDENDDKNIVANIKAEVSHEVVNRYLQEACYVARYDFENLSTIKSISNERGFLISLEFTISALIASSICYIVFPFIFKRGTTIGKKIFGLCLADSDGYLIKKWQLFMRVMPVDVVILSLLIPIWKEFALLGTTLVIILLVSFGIAMASPKHSALHDFTARTIVVDARTSILFENVFEEEKFIAKEDNIEIEEPVGGEEPDLKYEK